MDESGRAVRFAHISDLHVSRRPAWREYTAKRFVGYANFRINRRFRHQEERVAGAVGSMLTMELDAVLATGDMAQTGLPAEFDAILGLFAPLSKNGVPVLASDGNHDLYGSPSRVAWMRLQERLALGYRPDEFGVFRFPGVEILSLDQGTISPPFFSYGRVDNHVLDRALAGWERRSGDTVRVVCGHYPLVGEKGKTPHFFYGLKGAKKLLAFLHKVGAAAYLCGHHHKRFQYDLGGGVTQYVASSLSSDGRVDVFECRDGRFSYLGAG